MLVEPTSHQLVAHQSRISRRSVKDLSIYIILNYMKLPTDCQLIVNRPRNFFATGGELIGGCSVTYLRLVSDHFSSRIVVAMVAEAANKLSRREVSRRSQALWDRGFGLGLRLFKVKMGSLL